MEYKIVKLTQMLDTDSIHIGTVRTDNGVPDAVMAGIMIQPEFSGKAVAVAPIWNDADDSTALVAITTEPSPVEDTSRHVFAYACVPTSMDLENGYQLQKLLDLQL